MLRVSTSVLSLLAVAVACLGQEPQKDAPAPITFGGEKYFHRWSKDTQHEYTPAKQEDLNRWSEMVTINGYPKATDGDSLASAANTTLGNYKQARASIVKTSSVPRTEQKPAEHLIVVLFTRPTFSEAAFARFRMKGGAGQSVVYSHRAYGKGAEGKMRAWLKSNQATVEKQLNAVP